MRDFIDKHEDKMNINRENLIERIKHEKYKIELSEYSICKIEKLKNEWHKLKADYDVGKTGSELFLLVQSLDRQLEGIKSEYNKICGQFITAYPDDIKELIEITTSTQFNKNEDL